MQKILILSPHVDDDLYGCLGFILKYKERIAIRYVWWSEEQEERIKILRNIYKRHGITDIDFLKSGHLFEDGNGDVTDVRQLASILDDYTTQYETILVNSKSNHQDHNKLHEALQIALRPRPSLRTQLCYEYDYVYNVMKLSSEGCITYYYSQEIMNRVIQIFTEFEDRHSVGKDPKFVTHPFQIIRLNQFLGSYRGKPYAERYHVLIDDRLEE